jgi:hypothetical protein
VEEGQDFGLGGGEQRTASATMSKLGERVPSHPSQNREGWSNPGRLWLVEIGRGGTVRLAAPQSRFV